MKNLRKNFLNLDIMILDLLMREIRKRINPKKICDLCLRDFTTQTKDGKMLCDTCAKKAYEQQ